jgi:acetyl esterase/lipase
MGNSEFDVPALTFFPSKGDNAFGSAIIICPGGGYMTLAEHEGKDYALWLNKLGISCFVLKYRLAANRYRHPSMYQDVSRAVRVIRSQAKELEINPNHVGIMGSSAGGYTLRTSYLSKRQAWNRAQCSGQLTGTIPSMDYRLHILVGRAGIYKIQKWMLTDLGKVVPSGEFVSYAEFRLMHSRHFGDAELSTCEAME